MARPERHDVDYFPFLVKDGKTLFILENKYGCAGTGFFTNVMRLLTSTPDHHICIKEEADRLYFFSKCHCDEVSGAEMLLMMVKTGKIDKELYEKASVIVSQDHLDSIKDAYSKRKNPIITIEQIKEKYAENMKKLVSGDINEVSETGNELNSVDNTQRIGKDRIGKERIENTIAPDDKPKKIEFDFQLHQWMNLNGMVETWQERFPAVDVHLELNKMASWLEANPKNRKSNYQKFIVNWLVRAQDKAPAKGGKELW